MAFEKQSEQIMTTEYQTGTIVNKFPDKNGNPNSCYGFIRVNDKVHYYSYNVKDNDKRFGINDIVSGNKFKVQLYHCDKTKKDNARLIELFIFEKDIPIRDKAEYIKNVIDNILTCALTDKNIDTGEFEDQIYLLFKLLGIENLYAYPRTNQGGCPDGVFTIQSLLVIYDCTLSKDCISNSHRNKTNQIASYEASLRQNIIQLPALNTSKKNLDITSIKNRQIWIVSRLPLDLKEYNRSTIHDTIEIEVKNVTVQQIIDLLYKRINDNTFGNNMLEIAMRQI